MSERVQPGDRQLLDLLRQGSFDEARQKFPHTFTNPHVGYLCGYGEGSPVVDEKGPLMSLNQEQLIAALDYLEGPMRPALT